MEVYPRTALIKLPPCGSSIKWWFRASKWSKWSGIETVDSWWYPWQLSCFTLQPTAAILAIKIRWNIELCDRKSSTTLVWRCGFWKAVHTGLWSWQPGCHHTNYEQNWSSLTYISIFWLYSGVFLCFFWARYEFQRLCWSWRSSNETKRMLSARHTHIQLGWVAWVWVETHFLGGRKGRQSKCVKNAS